MDINFESLIQLQNLDEKIKKLSLFLENTPDKIRKIDEKIEASFQIVADAKEKLSKNQKRRRDLESEVQDQKNKTAKYKMQLNDVKTNKEYTSLLKEIEDAENLVESKEEEIISEMLAADEIELEIQTAEKKAAEEKERLLKEKEEILQQSNQKEEDKNQLTGEKQQLEPTIPSDQLRLYRSIFRKNHGIALSPVTDDFCSMCQIRIRPQVINELIAQTQIILCENCGRILYWQKKSS